MSKSTRVLSEDLAWSDSLSKCSLETELAWPRFLLAMDSYGRCFADPSWLARTMFPRRPGMKRKVKRWLDELSCTEKHKGEPPLIVYEAEGMQLVQVASWESRNNLRRRGHCKLPGPNGKREGYSGSSSPPKSRSDSGGLVPGVGEGVGEGGGGGDGASTEQTPPPAPPTSPPIVWTTDPPPEPVEPRHLALADRHREPQVRMRPNHRDLVEPAWSGVRQRWGEAFARLDAEFGADVVDGAMSRYEARTFWQRKVTEPVHWRRGGMLEEAHAEHVSRGSATKREGGASPPPAKARERYHEVVDFRVAIGEWTEHEGSREHELLEKSGRGRCEQGEAAADALREAWERRNSSAGEKPPNRPATRRKPPGGDDGASRSPRRSRAATERSERGKAIDFEAKKRELHEQAARVARGES